MPYADPDIAYVILLTGVNHVMMGLNEGEFEQRLTSLLPGARAETKERVTPTIFDDVALSASRSQLLTDAVAFRLAGRYLKGPASRKASGTNTPVWQIDANQLRDERLECLAEARKLEGLAMGGDERKKVLLRPRG